MPKVHAQALAFITPGIVLACVLLASCPSAFALVPSLDINQYSHRAWTVREGFFKGEVGSIAQTPDGYIWLGTTFGLVRFDGVKGDNWQPPQDQHLPSNQVMSLLVSRDGTLWIGTVNGLASFKNGKLTVYPETIAHFIFAIVEDPSGTVWVSALSTTLGKLCAIRNGSMSCEGEGTIGRGAFNLYVDSMGTVWAGEKDGLWRWSPGPPRFYSLPGEPNGIQGLGEAEDGTLLVAWNGKLQKFRDGRTEAYPLPGITEPIQVRKIFRDHDGSLWLATYRHGILRLHSGRTDVFAQFDGLSGDSVHALFEDRESNIWVTTASGLDRFRNFAVPTLTTKQGLSHDVVAAVLADKDGSLWFSTFAGLDRWRDGKIETYPLGQTRNPNDPASLFQDRSGRIWVSKTSGFGYLEGRRFVPISGVPQRGLVLAIAQDRAGDMWLTNEHLGLFHVQAGNAVSQIAWETFGHKEHASVLAADPRGGLWIGFFRGGITYFEDGQARASYTTADGLGAGRVSGFQFDHDGALWISTEEGGLSRLKNGGIATMTSKNGLPCDTVNGLIEDDDHAFWLYTACGLLRIARSELDAWVADPERAIQTTVFDTSDGVRSLAASGHYSPQVAKTSDGRIWFLPGDGVSVFDPRNLHLNKLPPPVHVEQFIADRKTYDASGQVRLPPLIRDLEIDYTALSLVAPEKILFRYKLEGYDRDWQDAGNRRQAFYTNLPPRNYRFRVMACNNSGVWNEAGTYFDFTIAPAYYQTTWFRVLLAIAFLMLLGVIYQLRVRQVAGEVRARMEERLEERERIARDLHDTLLQSVQGLILKFHAVAKQIPSDEPAHDALEKTLDHADEVLAEGRDRLRNLRGTSIPFGGLPAAFELVAEEIPQGADATFKTVVEGRVRELHPMVREECYWIGREAVVNALTHSNGRKVEVEITYDPRQFRLRVRDDGRGIDPKILEEGGRSDHWGLQGIRERAQKIGGQLKLWSRPETGTEVELIIPGASAYQTAHDKSKKFWLRPSSGKNDAAPKA
ncbi:MAG TPA: two-component regulator propeller domain-containing protein [Pyrinomonadaceae bacterium]|nr:two-component regulator propeller domain-containing protein [Pyrinomonadaceae bacterium]